MMPLILHSETRLFLAALWISDEFQLQDSVIKAEKNITSFRQENLSLELDLFQLLSYYVQGPPQNHWFVIFVGSQATGKMPEYQPRTQCPTFKKGGLKNSGILGCLNGQVCCCSYLLFWNKSSGTSWPCPVFLFFLLVNSLPLWDHHYPSVSCICFASSFLSCALRLFLSVVNETAWWCQLVPLHICI